MSAGGSTLNTARCQDAGVSTSAPAPVISFNRDIRPILSENCFFCHGPDRNKREADLRLDTAAGLLGEGDSIGVVVPRRPAESELYSRISSDDDSLRMPPPDSGKSLSPAEIDLLRTWIEQGGEFEGHWAFQPIQPLAESSRGASPTQVAAHIDQRVAEALARQNLQSVGQADRITLLRRLSFDLAGLPPSPQIVAEFCQDPGPDAYERAVDRLLASPHFGERMAIWWLDLVRYADTVGYHGDQQVSISPFRQYVIESFNANTPFDQFTIEQLAGDLLPNPTRQQQIASGYNRLGMMSAEGGVQDKEYLAKYIAERVRNASGTWLGITLGCAECHDHKFDPFTTRDFYRFEGFFADIKERGLYSGANADGNWGPSIQVPNQQQQSELARLNSEIADVQRELDTPTPALAAQQQVWESAQVEWTVVRPESPVAFGGPSLAVRADGAILASGENPPSTTYRLILPPLPPAVTAIRLEALSDPSLPNQGPGRAANGNFVLSEFSLQQVDHLGIASNVPLVNPTATFEQADGDAVAEGDKPAPKLSIAAAIDGDAGPTNKGWAIAPRTGQSQAAVFEFTAPLTLEQGNDLVLTLEHRFHNPNHALGCFRISVTVAPTPVYATPVIPDAIANILASPSGERPEPQQQELAAYYRTLAPILEPARAKKSDLERRLKELNAQIPTTLVTESVPPRMVRVLKRGNWMDDSGEVVTAGFPQVLGGPAVTDRTLTRLDLARWLVSEQNPLTARVLVNRVWKLLFGAGLARKLDDVGAQGDWPSHPELLDYLADDLRRNGWDLKRLIKAIVMSESYRRSSAADAALHEVDPYNRWLARQGRYRLDAEFVRDNALAVSGLLVDEIGGTSVFPYQPPGYWAYLNFPTREWQNGNGEDLYRRGLYTHWQRQYLHPSLLAFDAPNREECTADRPRSNTPLQALALLNDPTYVEAARAFAESLLRDGNAEPSERIDRAFRRALSRPAQPEEIAVLQALFEQHHAQFLADAAAATELLQVGAKPAPSDLPPAELAAWTSVTRAILNLHETITRY